MSREVKQHAYGDALLLAAQSGDHEIASTILKQHPKLANYQHPVQYTLQFSADNGHEEWSESRTYPSLPPLVLAVQFNQHKMVALFLEYNADPQLSGYPAQNGARRWPTASDSTNALATAVKFPRSLAILGERTAQIEEQIKIINMERICRDPIKKEEVAELAEIYNAQQYGEILKKLFDTKGYAQDKTKVETLFNNLSVYQTELNSHKDDEKRKAKLAVTVAAIAVLEKLLSSKSPVSDNLADYAKLIQTLDNACTQYPLWNDATIQSRSTAGKLIAQVKNVAYTTSFAPPAATAEPRPAGFMARFLGGRTANNSAQNGAQQPVDGVVLETKVAPK